MKARTAIHSLAISLLVVPVLAGSASADMIFRGMGLKSTVKVHAPGMNVLAYAGELLVEYGGQNYAGYCVDIYQHAASGPVNEWDVEDLNNGDMVAYLYEHHTGEVDTGLEAAALQVAIWEVLTEDEGNPFNASAGCFHITQNKHVAKKANEWLADLPDSYHTSFDLVVLQSDTRQDILVSGGPVVPEPATWSLLAFGAVALLRRRR